MIDSQKFQDLLADEPKLTYERVLNDVAKIIRTDSISSSCLHSKFFVIGTLFGRIYVFDHQGNKVDGQYVHLKPVNCISIDDKGEYLVSCSDDRIAVYGLFNNEHNDVLRLDNVHVVAMAASGRKFVAGADKVVLYERGFLSKWKSTDLQSEERKVRTLAWHGQFIAWSTDAALKIYDVDQGTIITKIKRDGEVDLCYGFETPQMCWKDRRTFVIGWNNTIKEYSIKETPHEVPKGLPKKYVEIVSMFETDFTIGGLALFDKCLLALSFHNSIRTNQKSMMPGTEARCNLSTTSSPSSIASTETAQLDRNTSSTSVSSSTELNTNSDDVQLKPQVHILETFARGYNELSENVLTPNGCLTVGNIKKDSKSSRTFPYSLLSIHEDGIYFIVCPKDVISAKPRNNDDHIDWLIEHSMLKEACAFARTCQNELTRHSLKQVEESYMNELLNIASSESYSEAASLCPSICGSNQALWDSEIEKFCDMGQLKHLLPFLPKSVDKFHLKQESYNFILEEFLQKDCVSFFRAINEIPSKLYNSDLMTDLVLKNLQVDPNNLILREALAELYSQKGKFEEAVNIYLDSNDKNRIFLLIRHNNLMSILRSKVVRLMKIDSNETSQLLVENLESIPMKEIVKILETYKYEPYLICYLHRLVLKDPDSCLEYHNLMVRLYALYKDSGLFPPESLLKFLKLSVNYGLKEALTICEEYSLTKEAVFLYSRIGNLRTALQCILSSQGDINEAIEFCKEHQDPDLWRYLIQYSSSKPEFMGTLLKNIGTYISNPIELIESIPRECEIDGLMPALVKILQDYQLQIALEQSCRDLKAKDCFDLLQKQILCQTRGIAIKEDRLCDHCNQPLLNESVILDNLSQTPSLTGVVGSSNAISNSSNDVVVFGCHHVFHEECCNDSRPVIETYSPSKIYTCKVCMLEKDYDNTSST